MSRHSNHDKLDNLFTMKSMPGRGREEIKSRILSGGFNATSSVSSSQSAAQLQGLNVALLSNCEMMKLYAHYDRLSLIVTSYSPQIHRQFSPGLMLLLDL